MGGMVTEQCTFGMDRRCRAANTAASSWGPVGAAGKLIPEALGASQHQAEQRQGPLTSGKDAAAPQLLSLDS